MNGNAPDVFTQSNFDDQFSGKVVHLLLSKPIVRTSLKIVWNLRIAKNKKPPDWRWKYLAKCILDKKNAETGNYVMGE